jgi:hypothetical protein
MSFKSITLLAISFLILSCAKKIQLAAPNTAANQEVQNNSQVKQKTNTDAAVNTTGAKKEMAECIDPSRRRPEVGCPDALKQVCGCNGKTYRNSCEADREGVTYYSPGKCLPVADF